MRIALPGRLDAYPLRLGERLGPDPGGMLDLRAQQPLRLLVRPGAVGEQLLGALGRLLVLAGQPGEQLLTLGRRPRAHLGGLRLGGLPDRGRLPARGLEHRAGLALGLPDHGLGVLLRGDDQLFALGAGHADLLTDLTFQIRAQLAQLADRGHPDVLGLTLAQGPGLLPLAAGLLLDPRRLAVGLVDQLLGLHLSDPQHLGGMPTQMGVVGVLRARCRAIGDLAELALQLGDLVAQLAALALEIEHVLIDGLAVVTAPRRGEVAGGARRAVEKAQPRFVTHGSS